MVLLLDLTLGLRLVLGLGLELGFGLELGLGMALELSFLLLKSGLGGLGGGEYISGIGSKQMILFVYFLNKFISCPILEPT
jgi:hypothetical protein